MISSNILYSPGVSKDTRSMHLSLQKFLPLNQSQSWEAINWMILCGWKRPELGLCSMVRECWPGQAYGELHQDTRTYLKFMPWFPPRQKIIVITNFHVCFTWKQRGIKISTFSALWRKVLTYVSCTLPGQVCWAEACHRDQFLQAFDPNKPPPPQTAVSALAFCAEKYDKIMRNDI